MPSTPPSEYIAWATDADAEVVDPGEAKQSEGFRTGEAPGAGNLNHLYNRACSNNSFVGKTLAGRIAMSNIEYTTTQPFGTNGTAVHITYDALSDKWYACKSIAGGNIYAYDSADGETWSGATLVATAATTPFYHDMSKVVTNGTICAIAVDDTVYTSSDLTVANLDAGTTFAGITDVSDMTYDDTNSLWIAAGANVSPLGVIETATVPTGTWTNQHTASAATDISALATNPAGISVGGVNTATPLEDVHSTNGTTWNTATSDRTSTTNNLQWAPSLGLFVGANHTAGTPHFSADGDAWYNQDTYNGITSSWSFVVTPEVMILFREKVTGANGIDNSVVHLFPNVATLGHSFTYETYGEARGETIPIHEHTIATYAGGQGKAVWLHDATNHYLAIARYGAS